MFQDIAEQFCLEYDGGEICDDDIVLAYRERQILCKAVGERLILPCHKDISGKAQFLNVFAVGEKRYFLSVGGEAAADGFEYKSIDLIKTIGGGAQRFAAVTGFHYYCFHEENKFCGRCGSPVYHDPKKRCMICKGCKNEIFPKISPAVIVGVIDEEKDCILLTKYAGRSYKKYALVAGFAEMGESAEQAAVREVMEETGIRISDLKYYASQPWGFAQNLLFGYFAKAQSRDIVMDSSELSEAIWVPRSEVEAYENSVSLTNEMMWAFKSGKI